MATTIQYPVTVTLEASTLLAQYVTLLARAALLRIKRAEADAYWASDEGQARSNAMYCGEQDAVSDRLDGMTSEAESIEAAAAVIGAAISAAGYPLPRVYQHELTLSDVLCHAIACGNYIKSVRNELGEIVASGRIKA